MPRVNLIGGSGSGVSTLGRYLAQDLGVPHFDSDDYYHGPSDPPFQKPRPPDQRARMMERDLNGFESWILSGGVVGWNPEPQLKITHFVLVETPTPVRLQRLRSRELERFGSRVLPGGDMHLIHEEFVAWAACYEEGGVEGKTLARHLEFLNRQSLPVFRCDGLLGASVNSQRLQRWLQEV